MASVFLIVTISKKLSPSYSYVEASPEEIKLLTLSVQACHLHILHMDLSHVLEGNTQYAKSREMTTLLYIVIVEDHIKLKIVMFDIMGFYLYYNRGGLLVLFIVYRDTYECSFYCF